MYMYRTCDLQYTYIETFGHAYFAILMPAASLWLAGRWYVNWEVHIVALILYAPHWALGVEKLSGRVSNTNAEIAFISDTIMIMIIL